uniref:ORF1 n=1 Tax=Chufflevirus sp. TaxID=2814903 RepID=A0A897ZJ87_9VIRU|nr:ORF1 [Chufflevirus sp.]
MSFTTTGFSVLAWVREDSPLLLDISAEAAGRVRQQLLKDFQILLSCRWHMEVLLVDHDGVPYAYGANSRINPSERTIKNAIGTLYDHVDFLRSTANTSWEDLARFKQCKEKWKVPDQVTEGSSGWASQEPQETSMLTKRKRYS